MSLISFIILVVIPIIGFWKTFEKAGEPGWYAIIPILNYFMLFKIAGKPMWWGLLLFIPVVNLIFLAITLLGLARMFGKSDLFAVGLFFFPFIFHLILGFGDAKYIGKTE